MKRVVLALVVALFAIAAGTTSASAAPIDVNANPGDRGVVVEVFILGSQDPVETITTGQLAIEAGEELGEETPQPGLCALGVIHTSCTPAGQ